MASGYKAYDKNVEDIYAIARSSIADDSMKNKYKYKDGTTEKDLADLMAIPPSGSNFETFSWYYNNTLFAPLKLVPKGSAPHIEVSLGSVQATEFFSTTTCEEHINIYRSGDNFITKTYTIPESKYSDIYTQNLLFEDFWTSTSGIHSISPTSGSVACSKAPNIVFFQLCAAGGGGGGSSGSYASKGGGSGASVCGVYDFSSDYDSIFGASFGVGGSGGAKGNTSTATNGKSGHPSYLMERSSTRYNQNYYVNGSLAQVTAEYYCFKMIRLSAGGGGGAGKSSSVSNGSGGSVNTPVYGIYFRIPSTGKCLIATFSDAPTNKTGFLVYDDCPEKNTYVQMGVENNIILSILFQQQDRDFFQSKRLFILDYKNGQTGGSACSPLTATFTNSIIHYANTNGDNFANGGSYGGGGSGMGAGGTSPGAGGGGNGRAAKSSVFDPGDNGYGGGGGLFRLYLKTFG